MPLPGGAADKFGNRYEQMWTIEQLIRLLQGNVDSVRIEDPNIDKAEFVIHSSGVKELHQAKRSHPDGKWSIASLSARKFLKPYFQSWQVTVTGLFSSRQATLRNYGSFPNVPVRRRPTRSMKEFSSGTKN